MAGKAVSWRSRAQCLGYNTMDFFPTRGADLRAAKKVCAKCPVTEECLEYALVNEIRHGIYGGLSERARRGLRTSEVRDKRRHALTLEVMALRDYGLTFAEVGASLNITAVKAKRLAKEWRDEQVA